ncbi:MAG TPA: hypothetical protein EYQ09_04195 [Flavobacteriales bacterium]|jgi:hypothetical protein|nr:hypothetical protein [Flavobacteriales bacterium]
MGSWGATTTDEAKPKYLTTEDQRDCYATDRGWTVAAGGNSRAGADREVLVAIRGLSGATKLAEATISSVNWVDTTYDASEGDTIAVSVNWNEAVTVTVGATIAVTNTGTGGTHTLVAPASTSNRATFVLVMAAGGASGAWAADDVLSIVAQNITGTIVGGDGATASKAISAANASGASTVTVVA